MNTKKTVFSRIAKGMPKKQVKLSVIDDIEQLYESLRNSYDLASYYESDRFDDLQNKWFDATNDIRLEIDELAINSEVRGLEEDGENMQGFIADLQEKALDLGVNPADLLEGYDEILFMVDNYQALYDSFVGKYRETINITNNNDFL
jgi:hypothetical protein